MAKQETTPVIAEDQQISLTVDQLQEIISAAVAKQNSAPSSDQMFSKLIEAVIESRKPYKDPLQAENDRLQRDADRAQLAATEANKKFAQDSCPHVKGLGGQEPGSTSSFWLHTADTGERIGICSFCQKVISSLVPEDAKFFAMKGSNVPSAAGVRAFLDPVAAMTARFPAEQRKAIQDRLYGNRPR
jgi:hypothetical protein